MQTGIRVSTGVDCQKYWEATRSVDLRGTARNGPSKLLSGGAELPESFQHFRNT